MKLRVVSFPLIVVKHADTCAHIDPVSLVPSPLPAFQCFTQKSFLRETLKSWEGAENEATSSGKLHLRGCCVHKNVTNAVTLSDLISELFNIVDFALSSNSYIQPCAFIQCLAHAVVRWYFATEAMLL